MRRFQKEFGVYDPHLKAWAIPAHRQLEFNVFALIASVMGSFASGPIGNILGRRAGLALTALSGILGAAISLAATNYKTLICGKVFTGRESNVKFLRSADGSHGLAYCLSQSCMVLPTFTSLCTAQR